MWLTDETDREEALEVFRALGVNESKLKYYKYYDEMGWMHKFEHHFGGRDGWSCLHVCKGPDWDDVQDYGYQMDEDDFQDEHVIFVNGTEYHFYEGD